MNQFDFFKQFSYIIRKAGNREGQIAGWQTRLEKYGPSGRANPGNPNNTQPGQTVPNQKVAVAMQWAQNKAIQVADKNVGKGGPWDYTDVPAPELRDAIASGNVVAYKKAKFIVWKRQLAKRQKIIHQASKTFLMQRYGIADVHRPVGTH